MLPLHVRALWREVCQCAGRPEMPCVRVMQMCGRSGGSVRTFFKFELGRCPSSIFGTAIFGAAQAMKIKIPFFLPKFFATERTHGGPPHRSLKACIAATRHTMADIAVETPEQQPQLQQEQEQEQQKRSRGTSMCDKLRLTASAGAQILVSVPLSPAEASSSSSGSSESSSPSTESDDLSPTNGSPLLAPASDGETKQTVASSSYPGTPVQSSPRVFVSTNHTHTHSHTRGRGGAAVQGAAAEAAQENGWPSFHCSFPACAPVFQHFPGFWGAVHKRCIHGSEATGGAVFACTPAQSRARTVTAPAAASSHARTITSRHVTRGVCCGGGAVL